MDDLALIRSLPKAEQHIHIVGATRPETLLWLVQEGDIIAPYKTLEDVERFFQYRDFDHFISVYSAVMRSIVDENQFERITFEMLENEHEYNVRHVEASFSAPDHTRLGLDYGLMLDAINRGIKRFDFLRGNESYKYHFGAQDHNLYTLTLCLPGERNLCTE